MNRRRNLCAKCRKEQRRRTATCERCGCVLSNGHLKTSASQSWLRKSLSRMEWDLIYDDIPVKSWAMTAPDGRTTVEHKTTDSNTPHFRVYKGSSYEGKPERFFEENEAEKVMEYLIDLGYDYQSKIQKVFEEFAEEPFRKLKREHPNHKIIEQIDRLMKEAKTRIQKFEPNDPAKAKDYLTEIPAKIQSIAVDITWERKDDTLEEVNKIANVKTKMDFAIEGLR